MPAASSAPQRRGIPALPPAARKWRADALNVDAPVLCCRNIIGDGDGGVGIDIRYSHQGAVAYAALAKPGRRRRPFQPSVRSEAVLFRSG
jgi:hypothetical protein